MKPKWKPDKTFYPSPQLAMEAPVEEIAYVSMFNPHGKGKKDALGVIDVNPESETYGKLTHSVEFPDSNNELHHFGWNACSSHLCGYAPHAHVERRYLIVPGIHTSQIHIIDTKPDPRKPILKKIIDAETIAKKTGYAAPHTVHCGPDAIYVNALGSPDGEGPGGIFMLDHDTFEVIGPWEKNRGPQYLSYDFWWHLGFDTMITSEWGTPNMVTSGLDAEQLLNGKYGHAIHMWDLKSRRHKKVLDMGVQYQMALELRPAHDPRKSYGFVGVVISLENLSSSIWMWYLDKSNGKADWKLKKVIDIPAEPANADQLPPLLKGFEAVPPLVTDINLSLDDQYLYVSCWGTGELRQYNVSDPFNPVFTGSVKIGGIVNRTPHPSQPSKPLNGAPQMVEVSRDGRRLYLTNSLYGPLDAQFYPDGIKGWMAKIDAADNGGITLDESFFLEFDELRPHQVRLQGGDTSSDSFCYN
jgi:methanethiol oxidase